MLPPRIGFIGLGIMGSAMVKNLIRAGFDVKVYNRTRRKTTEFQEKGIYAAPTCKILSLQCNVLLTMVTGDEAMRDITENPDGIFAAKTPGLTLINMSTNSVKYTKELTSKCFREGIRFIACPVSGSKTSAERGELLLMAGGDKDDVEKNKNLLLSMGKSIIYAGVQEKAAALKLCVNLILAHLTTAICESSALCTNLGLKEEILFESLEKSPALSCPYFSLKKPKILNSDYFPEFALKNMLRDVRLILAEAKDKKQNLPVTDAVEKLLLKSCNAGNGDYDLSIIMKTLETLKTERI